MAIGSLAREVRAASLLALMLALPLAFLALVPSGGVSPLLYDIIRVISRGLPVQAGPGRDRRRDQRQRRRASPSRSRTSARLILVFGGAAWAGLRRFA